MDNIQAKDIRSIIDGIWYEWLVLPFPKQWFPDYHTQKYGIFYDLDAYGHAINIKIVDKQKYLIAVLKFS